MNKPILTNFNAPHSTRARFDEVCRASGRTRTSVLVELMERYIIDQRVILETRNREIEKVDHVIEKSRQLTRFKSFMADQTADDRIARQNRSISEFDLPSPLWSDDLESW